MGFRVGSFFVDVVVERGVGVFVGFVVVVGGRGGVVRGRV